MELPIPPYNNSWREGILLLSSVVARVTDHHIGVLNPLLREAETWSQCEADGFQRLSNGRHLFTGMDETVLQEQLHSLLTSGGCWHIQRHTANKVQHHHQRYHTKRNIYKKYSISPLSSVCEASPLETHREKYDLSCDHSTWHYNSLPWSKVLAVPSRYCALFWSLFGQCQEQRTWTSGLWGNGWPLWRGRNIYSKIETSFLLSGFSKSFH